MSPLLIGMLGILVVPMFVASWRLSLLALAGQGLIMAWIGYQLDPLMDTPAAWRSLFDLLVVRGVAAPLLLYTALRARRVGPSADVRPPNLMSWTLAVAAVLLAFRFAELIEPTAADDEQTFIAVATASLLLGLLLLATQGGAFSQMVGVLRLENAIALFELGSAAAAPPVPTVNGGEPGLLELGGQHGALALGVSQTAVLVVTLLLFRWYLTTLPAPTASATSAVEARRP